MLGPPGHAELPSESHPCPPAATHYFDYYLGNPFMQLRGNDDPAHLYVHFDDAQRLVAAEIVTY